MVELAGGMPCFGAKEAGSACLQWADVLDSQPDVVLFMPCGFGLERAVEDIPLLTSQPGWDSCPPFGRARCTLSTLERTPAGWGRDWSLGSR
jgi:iron complex transport system substrate-binding protein